MGAGAAAGTGAAEPPGAVPFSFLASASRVGRMGSTATPSIAPTLKSGRRPRSLLFFPLCRARRGLTLGLLLLLGCWCGRGGMARWRRMGGWGDKLGELCARVRESTARERRHGRFCGALSSDYTMQTAAHVVELPQLRSRRGRSVAWRASGTIE